MLSQSGPMCGEPFTCFPTSRETRFDSQSFRLLLLRRLRLPLPFTARRCRCGRPLGPSGHHRAACARVGVLGRRGFALESAATRVCREAGGRVMTNMLVRDMDLAPGANYMADGRRLEVVVDGLSLFHGAQLAIHTTLVSAVCVQTEHRGPVQPGKEALPWMTRGHGKRSRIRSLLARAVVPSLSFSRQKWADVGLPRRHSSSAHLQHQKLLRRLSSCKRPWHMHGATGGEGCWRVPRRKLSLVLCWNIVLLSQMQEWSRRCTT